jgi:MYXO-CTERM domain-containing protein
VSVSPESRALATLLGLLSLLATLAWSPTARAGERALYYGGRVISNVEVVVVFWTSAVDATTQSEIGPFLTAVTGSAYFDWLEEYDTIGLDGQDMLPGSSQHIGRGTFSMAVTITPMNMATSLLDSDIQTELVAQINSGALPEPTTDGHGNVNTLYMVEFPPGYVIEIEGKYNCSSFCGYHYTIAYTGKSGTSPPLSVPYAVMPDIGSCGGSCGSGFDEVTSIHSHELIESVTDTEVGLATGMTITRPIAWYDPGDNMELADICDPFAPAPGVTGGTATIAGYTVQLIWSDFADACVAEIPICNGTLSEPACRPCTSYDDGVDCTGTTPVCQTSLTGTHYGECVGCIADANCAVPTPICDLGTTTCRACMPSDCKGKTPICGTSGACVECEATNYGACTGATPLCDVTNGQCVGCLSGIDCSGTTPVCNPTRSACEACTASTNCPTGQVCDTASDSEKGACVDCNTNTDCTFGTCNTTTHTCVLPVTDAGAPKPDAAAKPAPMPSSGCSCRASPVEGSGWWGLGGALVAVGFALRRRGRATRCGQGA